MTTALRLFWMRAAMLGVLLLLGLFLGAGVALAQDAAPAAPAEPSTKDLIDLIFSSAAAGAMSIGAVILAFLGRHVPTWLAPIFDYITTTEAKHWEDLTNTALDRAEAYARTKYDAVKDRSGYANAMATFLAMFNRELVAFADKNGNGIIDLIETRLPPAPTAPEAQQGFMAPLERRGVQPVTTKPRVSAAALDRLTAKMKGATKQ